MFRCFLTWTGWFRTIHSRCEFKGVSLVQINCPVWPSASVSVMVWVRVMQRAELSFSKYGDPTHLCTWKLSDFSLLLSLLIWNLNLKSFGAYWSFLWNPNALLFGTLNLNGCFLFLPWHLFLANKGIQFPVWVLGAKWRRQFAIIRFLSKMTNLYSCASYGAIRRPLSRWQETYCLFPMYWLDTGPSHHLVQVCKSVLELPLLNAQSI